VEGLLTDSAQEHIVKLSRTLPVVGLRNPEAVSGAIVRISDGDSSYLLSEKEPGIYATKDHVKGEVGRSYTLQIVVDGELYTARDSMVAAPDISPIEVRESDLGEGRFAFTLPGNFGAVFPYNYRLIYRIPENASAYYPAGWEAPKWYVDRIKENRMVSLDTTYYVHGEVEPAALFIYGEFNLQGILKGSQLTEYVYSMSEDYYRFIRAMMSETEWRGVGVVGSYPADVPGNISNGAYGFFAVSSIKKIESKVL
jgi:hypothetical protein